MAERGRPKKDDGRKVSKLVLMTVEEDDFIRDVSKRSGLTQSDIMRIGARNFANDLDKLYPKKEEYEDWELGIYDDYPEDDFGDGYKEGSEDDV